MSSSKRHARRIADTKRSSVISLESLEPRSMLSATVIDTDLDAPQPLALPAVAEVRSAPGTTTTPVSGRNTVTRGPASSVPQITIAAPESAVLKGDNAVFTISLSKAGSVPVTVNYATRNGGAAAGTDYRATSGRLVFNPGELTKQVSVLVLPTAKDYSPKVSTFSLQLSGASNAKIIGNSATATINNKQAADWTVLVYMTGDDLNTFAQQDINEMETAISKFPAKSVNIAVSLDQPSDGSGLPFATGNGRQAAWKTYGRSILTADSNPRMVGSTFEVSAAEKNTGDPRTLVDFIRWSMAQAPARRYALQIWGHGGGLTGSQFDSDNGGDALEIAEIAKAVQESGMPKFDMISYDNCLMNMLEVGYALAPALSANGVFVASEDLIPGTGQDYRTAYSALQNSPATVTPTQLGNGMVTSYGNQYAKRTLWDTYSTIIGSSYAGLSAAMKDFVTTTLSLGDTERKALIAAAEAAPGYVGSSSRDLGRFMATVAADTTLPGVVRSTANTVSALVATAVQSRTSDAAGSTGIAVYMPTTDKDTFLQSYSEQADAFVGASQWNTFANWLATGSRSLPTGGSPTTFHTGAVSAPGSRAAEGILAVGASFTTVGAAVAPVQTAAPVTPASATAPVVRAPVAIVTEAGLVDAPRARAFATFATAAGDTAAASGAGTTIARGKVVATVGSRLG